MQLQITGSNSKGALAPNRLGWAAHMLRPKWGVLKRRAKWEALKWAGLMRRPRNNNSSPINKGCHLRIIKKGLNNNNNNNHISKRLHICKKRRRNRNLWRLLSLRRSPRSPK